MADEFDDIKKLFEQASKRFGPTVVLPATVQSVNDDHTCVCEFSEGAVVDDVRLKSVVKDGNHFIVFPAVNSTVLVGAIENSREYVVLSVDEVNKVVGKFGTLDFELDATGLSLKKGVYDFKEAMVKLVQSVQQIVVVHGNNPNYVKLSEALLAFQNLLK